MFLQRRKFPAFIGKLSTLIKDITKIHWCSIFLNYLNYMYDMGWIQNHMPHLFKKSQYDKRTCMHCTSPPWQVEALTYYIE